MSFDALTKYWVTDLKWGWGHQSQLVFRFLREAAEFASGGVILDAGAGHQRYKPFFSECLYITQEHPSGIEFKKMQGISYDLIAPIDLNIPLSDKSVDAIISTSVVEHIRYPERFFEEAFRVLVPGGKLFINVPFAYPEHEIPYDFQRPTRYGLTRWLEDANFSEIRVTPSSSSTETAIAFLQGSLEQDLFFGSPMTREGGIVRNAFRWAKSHPLRFIRASVLWAVCMPLIRLLTIVARNQVDQGPTAVTTFPVGWIAVATKPGSHARRVKILTREEFLAGAKTGNNNLS